MVFKDGAINGAYREAMVKPMHNRLQICNKKGLRLHTVISNCRERQLQ